MFTEWCESTLALRGRRAPPRCACWRSDSRHTIAYLDDFEGPYGDGRTAARVADLLSDPSIREYLEVREPDRAPEPAGR